MLRERLFQILLSPFTLVYGLLIALRNGFYQYGLLKSAEFSIPVIGIGNLSLGGAGKTPHVEYLIRLLSPFLNIATLSRGYKRKTRGFRIVNRDDSAVTVGDESLQYFLKFRGIKVAVCESRSIGIPMLLQRHDEIQSIILDDSYQHRSVTPALNILLTEYRRPYTRDFLMPSGRLREWRTAAHRADIVIVSKCPDQLSQEEQDALKKELNLAPRQQLYFSRYRYDQPYELWNGVRRPLEDFDEVVLLTAIANADYLTEYLEHKVERIHTMHYEDHHYFSPHEVSLMKLQLEQISSEKKAIITTEKDATRLILHRDYIVREQLPIYILPAYVDFLGDSGEVFNQNIKDALLAFKA